MGIQQNRHTPASQRPVALAITQDRAQQHRLALIRLLGTTIIGAALLTGSAIYAKAAGTTETKDKAATQQKVKPEALKKTGEAATKDSEEEKAKVEKAKADQADADKQKEETAPADKPDAQKSSEADKPENAKPEATEEVAEGLVLPDYLDDRSTPQKLLESYYNAINRKEYVRAYSYYAEGQQGDDFEKYAKGYAGTESVNIKLGSSEPDPGAGQIYWSVPIAIESKLAEGKSQVYTGCYTISMSNPAMQALPPFKPMAIMAGTLSKSPLPLEKSVPEECGAP
ncbi:MAG: hypothetical protein LBI75_08005 [Brucellaceae bacterium]|jgi:hypothetical protein|nr:hypothetical protein [Brucellaceae bacterium]